MLDTHQIIVGLPSTGKTTFVAAFWHVVDSDEVKPGLVLEILDGNREYLNTIRARWLRCEAIGRTLIPSEQNISMKLRDRDTETVTHLHFPDMSGESFQLQWSGRKWTRNYADLVKRGDGVLVFVHPLETAVSIISTCPSGSAEWARENALKKSGFVALVSGLVSEPRLLESVGLDKLERAADTVMTESDWSSAQGIEVAAILLAATFRLGTAGSEALVAHVFETVHTAAEAGGGLKPSSWSRLEPLLPRLSLWNNWDRCERLRRGLILKWMKFDWQPAKLFSALHRPDTLARVVDYCMSRPSRRSFLRQAILAAEQSSGVTDDQREFLRRTVVA